MIRYNLLQTNIFEKLKLRTINLVFHIHADAEQHCFGKQLFLYNFEVLYNFCALFVHFDRSWTIFTYIWGIIYTNC